MNVFLGIRLSGANLDDTPLYIIIVYAEGVAVVIVFSEYLSLKKGDRVTHMATSKDAEGQWALLSTLGKLTKYGETLQFMYTKYQAIFAVLPKVYHV